METKTYWKITDNVLVPTSTEAVKSLKMRHVWAMPTCGKSMFASIYPDVFDADYANFHKQLFGSQELWMRRMWRNGENSKDDDFIEDAVSVGLAIIVSWIVNSKWHFPAILDARCYDTFKESTLKVPNTEGGVDVFEKMLLPSRADREIGARKVSAVSYNWGLGYLRNLALSDIIEPRVYFYRSSTQDILDVAKFRGDKINHVTALGWHDAAIRWGQANFDVMVSLPKDAYLSDILCVIDGSIQFLPDVEFELTDMKPIGSKHRCVHFRVTKCRDTFGLLGENAVKRSQSAIFWNNVLSMGIARALSGQYEISVSKRIAGNKLIV